MIIAAIPVVIGLAIFNQVKAVEPLPDWPDHLEERIDEKADSFGAPQNQVMRGNQGAENDEGIDPDRPGLLSRQSEIAESILLLERQLRQAELIGRLMEILGPDTPIEVLPGEFSSFSETPAGQRLTARLAEDSYRSRIVELQLQAELENARIELESAVPSLPVTDSITGLVTREYPVSDLPSEVRVHEIHGLDGNFQAIVSLGDKLVRLDVDDEIGGVGKVVSIDRDGIDVVLDGDHVRYAMNE